MTRPRRSDLVLVAGFVAGTVALSAALAPVNEAVTGLAARVLPHAPGFDLDQGDVARYGITAVPTVLAFDLVVDAVVNPFVEELYWKGHLLPRLPVAGPGQAARGREPLRPAALLGTRRRGPGGRGPVGSLLVDPPPPEPHGAAGRPLGRQRIVNVVVFVTLVG